MRVVDIMRKNVVTIEADSTFSEAALLLQEHGISAVVVLAENAPKGIVTGHDVVTLMAGGGKRADAKRQALADHQWEMVQYEEKQNEELLTLSTQILDLTGAIHTLTVATEGRNDGTVSAAERS